MIADYRIMRRLDFRADYGIPCTEINTDAARNLISSTSDANYNQIEEICGNSKYPECDFCGLFNSKF